jgi:hypothetical protein
MGLAGVKLALFSMNSINSQGGTIMNKRYESLVYITVFIAVLVGSLTVLTYTPYVPNMAMGSVELVEMEDIQPLDYDILEFDKEVVQLTEVSPDDYDGDIVIATADEVITMTIDDDGVKHFTNHLVG